MAERTHIPMNKRRLLIQIILLSAIGLLSFLGSFAIADSIGINPLIAKSIGVVVLIFSIITAGQKVKKRNEEEGGLLIDKAGITDHSSDIGIGLIKWSDIIGIDEEASQRAELIILKVKKQQDYIKKAKNKAVERLLAQNTRKFDTPVVIDTRYLMGTFDEVYELLVQEMKKRRKKT